MGPQLVRAQLANEMLCVFVGLGVLCHTRDVRAKHISNLLHQPVRDAEAGMCGTDWGPLITRHGNGFTSRFPLAFEAVNALSFLFDMTVVRRRIDFPPPRSEEVGRAIVKDGSGKLAYVYNEEKSGHAIIASYRAD